MTTLLPRSRGFAPPAVKSGTCSCGSPHASSSQHWGKWVWEVVSRICEHDGSCFCFLQHPTLGRWSGKVRWAASLKKLVADLSKSHSQAQDRVTSPKRFHHPNIFDSATLTSAKNGSLWEAFYFLTLKTVLKNGFENGSEKTCRPCNKPPKHTEQQRPRPPAPPRGFHNILNLMPLCSLTPTSRPPGRMSRPSLLLLSAWFGSPRYAHSGLIRTLFSKSRMWSRGWRDARGSSGPQSSWVTGEYKLLNARAKYADSATRRMSLESSWAGCGPRTESLSAF